MGCYHPKPAWRNGDAIGFGYRHTFDPQDTFMLPCGKCLGCLQARATSWSHRAEHEASLSDQNSLIRLSYDEKHLPAKGELIPYHLTTFIKRLREHANRNSGAFNRDRSRGIKYLACGEYGEQFGRPHYHVLLFNCGFLDHKAITAELYEADMLRRLWKHGGHTLADAQPGGAAGYIAKYTLKDAQRLGTPRAQSARQPPFIRVSKGIGKDWLRQNHQDIAYGYLVNNARKHTIPRYYLKQLEEENPAYLEQIRERKTAHRKAHPSDANQGDRLRAAELIHERRQQLAQLRDFTETPK